MVSRFHPRPFLGLLAVLVAAAVVVVVIVTHSSGRPLMWKASACVAPYAATSPWNTPIAAAPAIDASSARYVASMDPGSTRLSSDPTQYTYPLYNVTNATAKRSVASEGWFSDVVDGGRKLVNRRAGVARVPLPSGAAPSAGSDAQIIVINDDTGEEWEMSQFSGAGKGTAHALNVGHYNVTWSGVPPRDGGDPWWLRGSGLPYLAGLVRPCEIAQGHIDHALAFAYPATSPRWVYPASKSDGSSAAGMPEGTRLQLSPTISDATIRSTWGCRGACFTIAKALQRYGMYLIDGSGHPKLFMEYEGTAHWNGAVTSSTVAPIPLAAFRALAP